MEQKNQTNGGVFERAEYAKKDFWNERFEKFSSHFLFFYL